MVSNDKKGSSAEDATPVSGLFSENDNSQRQKGQLGLKSASAHHSSNAEENPVCSFYGALLITA